MKIQYRKYETLNSRAWFAVMRLRDKDLLHDHLMKQLLRISEASTCGLDQDRELWSVATTPDRDVWRRSQEHRNQPNTMISVLAGGIKKLREGDLTEKQLDHVRKIQYIMHELTGSELWEFEEVTSFTPTGNRLQDLQDRLFA